MEYLTHKERETIAEVGNISLAAAASALSSIINRQVDIATPRVEVMTVNKIRENFSVPCLLVETSYNSALEGENVLLIKQEDALIIAALMIGMGETPFLGEMELGAIQEAMNQMMESMATSMSEMLGLIIGITPPRLTVCNLAEGGLERLHDETLAVQVLFSINVEGIIDSKLIQVIPLDFAKRMAASLLAGAEADLNSEQPADPLETGSEKLKTEEENNPLKPALSAFSAGEKEPVGIPAFEMFELGEEAGFTQWGKLDIVKGIPLEVTVVLGKTRVPLGSLFVLGKGGVMELDQLVGEPVEVRINEKLIALGEIVLVGEQFGVRITRQYRAG